MYDGFSCYEGTAVRWEVYHNKGTNFVYAITEQMAYQRFMARYPNLVIKKIVRS